MMLSLGASVAGAAIWPLGKGLFSKHELMFKKGGLLVTMLILMISSVPTIFSEPSTAFIGLCVAIAFLTIITVVERVYHFHFLAIVMLAVHNLPEGVAGAIDYHSVSSIHGVYSAIVFQNILDGLMLMMTSFALGLKWRGIVTTMLLCLIFEGSGWIIVEESVMSFTSETLSIVQLSFAFILIGVCLKEFMELWKINDSARNT